METMTTSEIILIGIIMLLSIALLTSVLLWKKFEAQNQILRSDLEFYKTTPFDRNKKIIEENPLP